MSSYITNTTKTWVTQHAMYAAAPSDQFRPVPGTPGAAGLGVFSNPAKEELQSAADDAGEKTNTYSNSINTALKSKKVWRGR